MSEKEVKCPWCGVLGTPKTSKKKQPATTVIERRCASCKKVISAYAADQGDFLPKIRVFKNA